MAITKTETIPERIAEVEQRTEEISIRTPKGQVPTIEAWRSKRIDGVLVSLQERKVSRSLATVAGEPFGSTGLTIAQAAQGMSDTFDRWAVEDATPLPPEEKLPEEPLPPIE